MLYEYMDPYKGLLVNCDLGNRSPRVLEIKRSRFAVLSLKADSPIPVEPT